MSSLEGLRVLDLADRSGALAGRILADLGAEVLLVEPAEGNPIRRHAPFIADGTESAAHQYFSANKRSVVLDPATDPVGFDALVATADVVIDTTRPGRRGAAGVDHARLRAVNPRLVQCSITPFGLDGDWCEWAAPDLIACSAAGLVWVSGERRGVPVQGGSNVSHAMAGLIAAAGITIALHQRDRQTGHGTHIDVSLQEAAAMATMQTANATHWTWHGRIPHRPGLSAALKCADGGHVSHLTRPDRMAAFLAWADRVGIDHGMTVDDWRWARLDAPYKDNPVIATTRELAARLSRDEFVAGALEADIVCLPVLGFEDLGETEQYEVNDQFVTVANELLGTDLGFPRSPVDGMADPIRLRRAPSLGEDQHLLGTPTARRPVPDTEGPVASAGTGSAAVADPTRALEGVRIVDFSWVLAGPLGTRVLASFGAEVIRIESSKRPDSMRSQIGPDGVPDADLGGLYNTVNAGKKSFAVDVSTDAGAALVRDLIETADVVVNNFRPGAMDRMGFGDEVLRALRPDIISLSLPGAHSAGPWAGRPTMGNILMAASGFNMLTGFEGHRPRGIGIPYPDFTSPHLLVAAIVSALRQRDRTGQGQQIELVQLSGMISLLGAEWLHHRATGELPARRSNRDPNFSPHGVYPAQPTPGGQVDEEWVALAVDGDEQWQVLAALIGGDASDPRFATHADRKRNEDELDELVGAWTAGRDKWELSALLQGAGVAAAPVEHLADTFDRDPQLRHRHQTLHQPARPDVDVPVDRETARWVGAEHPLTRAPALGEHNHEVVCGLLGRSDEEYAQLVIDDVLG